MRIHTRQNNRRRRETKSPQLFGDETNQVHVKTGREPVQRVTKRQMHGRKNDFKSRREKGHRKAGRLRLRGKKVGLSFEPRPDRGFMNWGSDNSRNLF
jgi:hypothetical protein